MLGSLPVIIGLTGLTSLMVALLLVFTVQHHGRFTMDAPGAIQKFHVDPTPRIGGVAICAAIGLAWQMTSNSEAGRILGTIWVAGAPALAAGLLEDVTKRVSVAVRLLTTMVSGFLACRITGVSLTHLDVPMLDSLLTIAPVAVLVTAFAVAGVANALNIVDGFHGLASGAAIIAALAIADIAVTVGDVPLAIAASAVAAALAGFWLVNFPWGKLFLGDGGAYFAGFALAWLAVLLPMRNLAVSPWASLLICAYPIIEVLYSIVRRGRQRQSPGTPDRAHLHSLVAVRVVQPLLSKFPPHLQNSGVSILMWILAAVPVLAAAVFFRQTDLLVVCAAAFLLLYHLIYRRLAQS